MEILFLRTLIIILFCNLINLNYASYNEYTLSSDKLCSEVNKRKISMSNDAIKVSNTRTFDGWLGYKIFHCKFKIRASQHQGIYAVFQELSFRKDSNGQCIDYVQFKENNQKNIRKYCGNISILSLGEETNITNENGLLNYSFRDYYGDIEVVIHVANKKLESDEQLELKIVFTPFQRFEHPEYRDCVPGESIKLEYFYDGIVNCPYVGCVDENTCSIGPARKGERNNLKITAGAIGTVILAFILFFICIYNIKRHKVLCWAENPHLNNTTSTRATSCPDEDGETRAHLNALHLTTTSSASPSAPLPQEDKDLPPTYDSLFPNR